MCRGAALDLRRAQRQHLSTEIREVVPIDPREVENRLVNQRHLPEALTLVVASHHGSRSSSTSTFVSHVRPEFVVYSAGYRSQHGHPHQEVVARYAARGSRAFNTAEGGALVFSWQEGVLQPVRQQRLYQPRYWFD